MGRHFEVRAKAMEATAKKKSAIYMRASKEIYIAAKQGTPDPDSNLALRSAIDKYKSQGVPKDVIERAIKKAAGGEQEAYIAGRYEFFGPGGSLLIVDSLTDNPNRALVEIKTAIVRKGGHMANVLYNFEEKGLKIELSTGQGADAVMTSVLANQVEIGFAGPEASIYVYNEGKEDYTEVFAQLTKKDGSLLVSRTDEENFSWENLKGKTVIPGRKGGVPYMTLEYVLKKNGINPETDVVLDDSIKFDLMAGAFAAGNADYVTLFEPTASLTEQEGKGYVVASVGEEAGEIPYTAYFAKKSYIDTIYSLFC